MRTRYDFASLRRFRKQRGLTLQQLAERTGIAYSTLAAIETNKRLPALDTLDRLAEVLCMPLTDLLSAVRNEQPVLHAESTPAEDTFEGEDRPRDVRTVDLAGSRLYRWRLSQGQLARPQAMHSEFMEVLYILAGKVEVTVDGRPRCLSTDEALFFDGGQQHAYLALEDAELISIHAPKNLRFTEMLLQQARVTVG